MANDNGRAVQQNGVPLESIQDDILKLGNDQSAFRNVSRHLHCIVILKG